MTWLHEFLSPALRALSTFRAPVIPGKTAPRFRAPEKRWVPLSLGQQLDRADRLITQEAGLRDDDSRILYRLDPGKNGGRDPREVSPASHWRDGDDSYNSSDCIGTAVWLKGVDRFEPETFAHYGGWMNTDSILLDARGWHGLKPQDHKTRREKAKRSWWEVVEKPYPGCLLVYGSIDRNEPDGRIGHVAMWRDGDLTIPMVAREFWEQARIIHCSSGNARTLGHAVAGTNALAFYGRDKQGRPKDTAFVDLVTY